MIKITISFLLGIASGLGGVAVYSLLESGKSTEEPIVKANTEENSDLSNQEPVNALRKQLSSAERERELLRIELAKIREQSLAQGLSPGHATSQSTSRSAHSEHPNIKETISDRPGEYIEGLGFVPTQSASRPHGLTIAGLVRDLNSDLRSRDFRDELLPGIIDFMVNDSRDNIKSHDLSVDSGDLSLVTNSKVRAYFIAEAAAFRNSIGVNTTGIGIDEGSPKLIFPNASESTGALEPIEEAPLKTGDYVDLGEIQAGEVLDLFIISNGANHNNGRVYSASAENNNDQTDHMIVHGVVGEDTLLVGFEDLHGGGDKNYTDVVIALQIGEENVQAFLGEEPTAE
ncbi:MAG: DUF4114 domain-containing protein [Verrucomicrobiota bacterium]